MSDNLNETLINWRLIMTDQIENGNKAIGVVDYSKHTSHKKKATPFTYNYATIDGVVAEVYINESARTIANTLNEYLPRVKYRIAFLQKNHPSIAVYKRGATVNKGTHKATKSDVGQKRKVNG